MITWSFPMNMPFSYHSTEAGAIMIPFAEEAKDMIARVHSCFCPMVPPLHKSAHYLNNHNGISAPCISVPAQTPCLEFHVKSGWVFSFTIVTGCRTLGRGNGLSYILLMVLQGLSFEEVWPPL